MEPATKYNLILLEKQANLSDIATLKNDAYQAEVEKNIELAKQLWIRVNIAASGSDMEAINAISRLNNSINYSKSENKENNSSSNDPGKKSSLPKVAKKLIKTFPTIQDFVSRSFLFIFTGILGAFLATITVSILEKNKNIEYSTLENLLKQKKWKEADWETFNIMLKVTNLEKEGGLNTESIKKFSCSNLRIIDLLWQKYSDDKLGFSAQSRIYQSLAGTKEYDDESWKNFGDKVGWREAGKWLSYSDSRLFNISQPEQGRFPVTRYWQGKFYVNDIFLRAETCKF
ncbi:MAG: GUN4 domain-containing protein [Okeania sp. SIO2H7]|nr:GUN4 domain-containing protein [Okeania sp. SIO2H7]